MPKKINKNSWHTGEKLLHEKLGEAAELEDFGRHYIETRLSEFHRAFLAHLPFIVLGLVDDEGRPWATIRTGKPGFLSSPAPQTLIMDFAPSPQGPAEAGLKDGRPLGLIGIDFSSRARIRVNGLLGSQDKKGWRLNVNQSYGNCPKYIQKREYLPEFYELYEGPAEAVSLDDELVRELIGRADTFFVTSWAEVEGQPQADVSHRGGRPGFVAIGPSGDLIIPDLAGNHFFQTFGNFMLNPLAGLMFIDFESGNLLQVSGRAKVDSEAARPFDFKGAERIWTVRPERMYYRRQATTLRWHLTKKAWSPNTLRTGSWSSS